MDVFKIILKIVLIGVCGVAVYYIGIACSFFWLASEWVCSKLKKLIHKIGYPFGVLWRFITTRKASQSLLSGGTIEHFARRHPVLGTAKSIRFFIVAIIFIAVMIIISLFRGNFSDLVADTFSMFPFAFALQIINGDAAFSLVGAINTGFSAMLMAAFFQLCMGNYERIGYENWLVSVGYYVVTTITGCLLGLLLCGMWDWGATTGFALFDTLKEILLGTDASFIGIVKAVGCAIALIMLVYIGILLLLVAVREYIEAFCYGALGFVLVVVVALLLNFVISTEFLNGTWGQIIVFATLFVSVLCLDYIRVNKGDLFSDDKAKSN